MRREDDPEGPEAAADNSQVLAYAKRLAPRPAEADDDVVFPSLRDATSWPPGRRERPYLEGLERPPEDGARSLLADVFESFPVGVARVDHRGVIHEANERLVQLVGRRRRTTLGHRMVSLLGKRSQPVFLRHLTRAFLSGGYEETEVELAHDGEGRWVHLSTTREEAPADGLRTCLVAVWEITARREAEQRLRQSESSFRALIDELPDAVWVHRWGRLIYANLAARTLLEWGDGPVEGQPLAAWLHPDDRSRGQDLWREVDRSRGPVGPWAVRLLDSAGAVVNAEAHELAVLFDGTWANVTIARDLTERHRLQAQVIQNDRLASMGALSAGIAHEINNPLTFILTNIETALVDIGASADPLETLEHVKGCLEDAWSGARRVRELVREMRKLSHFDQDRAIIDLREVAETALRVAAKELEYKSNVTRAFDADVPLVVGNRGQLFQVVLNLLLNAAQALDDGERHEIVVRTRRLGRWALIEVEDDGPGIPEDLQHRVFEPFFTTKPVGEGTGLGLAICHGIVRQHEGELVLDSAVGRGTRIEVRLPVPTEAQLAEARPPEPADRPSARPPAAAPPTQRRILVVDDEQMVGRAITRALRARHEVRFVQSVAEAQGVLRDDQGFDLVLCDVMMPGGTGLDLYAWVEETLPDLTHRVVMMTGGFFVPEAEQFIAERDIPFVRKPFMRETVERLLDRVEAELDGGSLRPPTTPTE